jgi:hypothetical protein
MSLHLVTGYAGREHVTSADHGSFNIAFVGNGEYVFDRGQNFAASIIDNNTVDVADGDILMQGRHIRQIENHVTRLTFENGERGFYRNDLIVAEYRKDPETFVESATLKVLKGTQTDNVENVTDPEYTHGDITEATGAMLNQMPLYRVRFTGYEISAVESLFTFLYTHEHMVEGMWDSVRQVTSEAQTYYEEEESRYTETINESIASFNEQMEGRVDRADEVIAEMQEHYYSMEQYTFLASGWNQGKYSLESRYPSQYFDILNVVPSNANTTKAMLDEWTKAKVYGYEPTNKIVAHGKQPTNDIVMVLQVLNKRDHIVTPVEDASGNTQEGV